MREYRLLSIEIRTEADVVLVRQRARRIASLLELSDLASTRFATAASEIARNAYQYAGGGRVEFALRERPGGQRALFLVRVTDEGPGIGNLDEILSGRYVSPTGLGAGLIGTQRIAEHFEIESARGRGTMVEVGASLELRDETGAQVVGRLGEELARLVAPSPYEELHRQSRELVDALEQAHQALQMREDILAVVSHDLRNPLSVIGMSAAIAARCQGVNDDPRATQAIERIDRAVKQMDRLISDLLDVASIQAGQLSIKLRAHHARSLLSETLEMHQQLADEHGVELRAECEVDHELVLCDAQRVMQVFANLVGNALKFAPAGSTIVLDAVVSDGRVRYGVHDRGPGIAAEDLPHLFDPYWSAHRHEKKGTGLGLFICKGIVSAHRGEIWARSRLGQGTSFFFTLPDVDPAQLSDEERAEQAQLGARRP